MLQALCFALLVFHLNGQIILFNIFFSKFVYFFQSWRWSRPFPAIQKGWLRPLITSPVSLSSPCHTSPCVPVTLLPVSLSSHLPVSLSYCLTFPCLSPVSLLVSLSSVSRLSISLSRCLAVSLSPCFPVSLFPSLFVSLSPVSLSPCLSLLMSP